MMEILITGAHGFIGQYLAAYANKKGATVSGIGYGTNLSNLVMDVEVSNWLEGEITTENLDKLYDGRDLPEVIFHLAGGSAVGASFNDPFLDFERTVYTSAVLFDWIHKRCSSAKVVCISSAAVYGDGLQAPIRVTDRLKPYSPYGVHKAMMENVAHSYMENFGIESVCVRPFSVYGEGLRKQLLWDLCNKIQAGDQEIILGGTGNEIRDWLHVSDAAALIWSAQYAGDKGINIINGGTGVGTSVKAIAQLLIESWGRKNVLSFSGNSRAGDPSSLLAEISEANTLGFKPEVELKDGIESYVRWYQSVTLN